MIGYDFHPEARLDVDEIWEFIGEDNLAADDRLIGEILTPFAPWFLFRVKAPNAQTLPRVSPLHLRSRLRDHLCAG